METNTKQEELKSYEINAWQTVTINTSYFYVEARSHEEAKEIATKRLEEGTLSDDETTIGSGVRGNGHARDEDGYIRGDQGWTLVDIECIDDQTTEYYDR